MSEPTKQQKLDALMRANKNLDFESACKLLGYNPAEIKNPQSIFRGIEEFSDLFRGMK